MTDDDVTVGNTIASIPRHTGSPQFRNARVSCRARVFRVWHRVCWREPPRPRTAPIPKIDVRLPRPREEGAPAKAEDGRRRGRQAREPPQLDDMAVAREICRSLDVLSRETGESRETWRTKIFGATPPPKGARQ